MIVDPILASGPYITGPLWLLAIYGTFVAPGFAIGHLIVSIHGFAKKRVPVGVLGLFMIGVLSIPYLLLIFQMGWPSLILAGITFVVEVIGWWKGFFWEVESCRKIVKFLTGQFDVTKD